ncbi:hypothetical protein E3N88_19708 [Mikania micrantha]|uniref:HMA domain-containing protein n=1 Tax=Mikania micrantha TaxID=192012 RepID=A0A5N6NNZ7_9ASTR|nr:hypothetical protein E3N88_19708 [Mikania micrantha]
MAVIDKNDEDEELEFEKDNLAIVPTTLATIESLTIPLVQEVVLLADFRCKSCQDRVAHIVSKLNETAGRCKFGIHLGMKCKDDKPIN